MMMHSSTSTGSVFVRLAYRNANHASLLKKLLYALLKLHLLAALHVRKGRSFCYEALSKSKLNVNLPDRL